MPTEITCDREIKMKTLLCLAMVFYTRLVHAPTPPIITMTTPQTSDKSATDQRGTSAPSGNESITSAGLNPSIRAARSPGESQRNKEIARGQTKPAGLSAVVDGNMSDVFEGPVNTPKLRLDNRNRSIERISSIREKILKAQAENNTRTIESIVRENPMIYMEGMTYRMGVNDPSSTTGEYPVRTAAVKPFRLDRYPVTNGDFMVFQRKKIRYRTTAQKAGFSWTFFADKLKDASFADVRRQQDSPWWYGVKDAYWRQPGGDGSDVMDKLFHPVVHVSYHDAYAFCQWAGKRLATEYEWEYAVRGGLKGMRYPWSDKFLRNRANMWQGLFPAENHKTDGYYSLAPVNAYIAQNQYGFYDMVGNCWEWTSTVYKEPKKAADPDNVRYVVKGGSFIDSKDGRFNHEVRCAARLSLRPNYTAGNVGFRCAKSVPFPKQKEASEQVSRQAPKHHKLEDTWTYKVQQVVKDVLDNIKDTVKLGDEL